MLDDNMSRRIVKVRSQIRKSVQKKAPYLRVSVRPKPGFWSTYAFIFYSTVTLRLNQNF